MNPIVCMLAAVAFFGAVIYLLLKARPDDDELDASGSNPCLSPYPQPYGEDDYRGSYQMQNCAPRCLSQLDACRQACDNMPLCDQRATCRQGCDAMAKQCMGQCPTE